MPILKKSNPIHFSLTLLLIASILLVIASSPESQQGGTLFAQQDDEKTSAVGDDAKIDEIMKRMKSAGRSFRRALRANKLDEALVHIQKAQAATLETKELVPGLIAEMEDPRARSNSLTRYRLAIIATLEQWLHVERAVMVGDTKTAGEHAKKISEIKKNGHQEFRKDED